MELYDSAIIQARAALTEAHKREPSELTRVQLIAQNTELRKYLKWAIQVADDAADTELDEEISQITTWGGVYIAPKDTVKLCDPCLEAINCVYPSAVPASAR